MGFKAPLKFFQKLLTAKSCRLSNPTSHFQSTHFVTTVHSESPSDSVRSAGGPVSAPYVCRFTCSVDLKLPAQSCVSPAPCCSGAPAGSVQSCAPVLTPRAAYGKVIRASVPLKKGTERNTTAWTRCRVSLFHQTFFTFPLGQKFLQDPVLLSAFSIYFPSCLLPDHSLPSQSLIQYSFHITLMCLSVLLSTFLNKH